MNDQKLTFKEFATLTAVAFLATPIIYAVVFADFGWWL